MSHLRISVIAVFGETSVSVSCAGQFGRDSPAGAGLRFDRRDDGVGANREQLASEPFAEEASCGLSGRGRAFDRWGVTPMTR
jgi:hypothetical protein